MKFASFSTNSGPSRVGIITNAGCIDLALAQAAYRAANGNTREGDWVAPADMRSFIEGGKTNLEAARRLFAFVGQQKPAEYILPLDRVRLHAPITDPLLFGELETNCMAQFEQLGWPRRNYPAMVILPDNVINDPCEPIPLPAWSGRVAISAQIVFVCGRAIEGVTEAAAEQAIFGYMLSLCMTSSGLVDKLKNPNERDISVNQDYGRWFDGFRPLGPYLVTRDEIHPLIPRSLELGVGKQRVTTNTSAMLHTPARILATLSEHIPFYPGDLVGLGALGADLILPPGSDGQEIPVTVTVPGFGTLETLITRTSQ